jgi:hypothetical protein
VASQGAVGLQICLYNPDMDGSGVSGRGLVHTLSKALAEADATTVP